MLCLNQREPDESGNGIAALPLDAMNELLQKLEASQWRIHRILSNPLASSLISEELKVKLYEREDGTIERQFSTFPPEQIDAFILNYRLLIQDGKEEISFRKIRESISECEILNERIPDLPDDLKQTSESMICFLASQSGMKSNGKEITNSEILKAFLYGCYAHESEAEKLKLVEWTVNSDLESFHGMFVSNLKRIVGYLVIFESIFTTALGFLKVHSFGEKLKTIEQYERDNPCAAAQ